MSKDAHPPYTKYDLTHWKDLAIIVSYISTRLKIFKNIKRFFFFDGFNPLYPGLYPRSFNNCLTTLLASGFQNLRSQAQHYSCLLRLNVPRPQHERSYDDDQRYLGNMSNPDSGMAPEIITQQLFVVTQPSSTSNPDNTGTVLSFYKGAFHAMRCDIRINANWRNTDIPRISLIHDMVDGSGKDKLQWTNTKLWRPKIDAIINDMIVGTL